MKDINELFEEYLNESRMYNLEGTDGVRKLDDLCAGLGYTRGQFIGANPIMNFLADNPGALELLMGFISEHISYNSEWQEGLELDIESEDEMIPV
jgi:hypothetical protein